MGVTIKTVTYERFLFVRFIFGDRIHVNKFKNVTQSSYKFARPK